MSAHVYSVPDQTEGRRKVFLEWRNIDLSNKLSFTCGGNVNYYKSVYHPILTLPVGMGTPWKFSKQIRKLYFQLSVLVYSLLGQTEEKRMNFFGGCKKEGCIVRLPLRPLVCHKRWKSLSKRQNPAVSKAKV